MHINSFQSYDVGIVLNFDWTDVDYPIFTVNSTLNDVSVNVNFKEIGKSTTLK